MIAINLNNLLLYNRLLEKTSTGDPVAGVLNGYIISLSGDAAELLGLIRRSFPSYTSHDLQHSFRIIKRVEEIISPFALEKLSAIEIFSFIIAASFHDIGMIKENIPPNELRKIHHIKSEEFLKEYLTYRMASISEYIPRLVKCIGFIARAHGMTWEEMSSHELFNRTEKVLEQPLRVNILSILLRIGDLLDLDSDRSCDPLRRFAPELFIEKSTLSHHERHKHVCHFNYCTDIIEVEVEAYTKEEHTIWTEWLGYIKQDILHANTYIFKGDLSPFQLPKFSYKVLKAANANYELWALRFEIDDKGRIWDVISQSIYTGKFDFLRELIQNSIDACVRWIYLNTIATVNGCNPKFWRLNDYTPTVIIAYSEKTGILDVIDNGIGMDKDSLKHFLFNVANTGYKKSVTHRDIPFPSIAKFGIGFVSCLVRANKISVTTKSRENMEEGGRKVILKTEALDAFSETCECKFGTQISLHLKKNYTFIEIQNYLQSNFFSPSVKIVLYEKDLLLSSIDLLSEPPEKDIIVTYDHLIPDSIDAKLETISDIVSKIHTDVKNKADTFTDINLYLLKKYGLDNAHLRKLSNIHSFIRPQFSQNTNITKPIFLYLDKSFEVQKVGKKYKSKSNSCDTALLYVPVQINDLDFGIEWFSVHGFIINRLTHQKTLIRYTGNELHKDNTIILTQKEYEEERYNSDQNNNDFLYDNDLDSEIHNEYDGFPLRSPIRDNDDLMRNLGVDNNTKIIQKLNGIFLADDNGQNDSHYNPMENYFREIKNAKINGSNTPTQEEILLGELGYLITDYINGVAFQDGIKLQINASAIAPIGACYARCNLFGNARFDLNVTRNSINESNTLLSNWMSNTGKKIQKTILETIVTSFNENNIKYNPDQFAMTKNYSGSDIIYEYSIPLLKSLVKVV